jgi:hypothetical protein
MRELDTVSIHGDEWKLADLADNVGFFRNQSLNRTKWSPSLVNADPTHDHCYICYWTIFETEDPECGYAFASGAHWICLECHALFFAENAPHGYAG